MATIEQLYKSNTFKRPVITRMNNNKDYVQEQYMRMGEVRLKMMDNTRDYVRERYSRMAPIRIPKVDNTTDRLLNLYNGK